MAANRPIASGVRNHPRAGARFWRWLGPGFLAIFWAVSLRHLAVVPPVYEDEPWLASSGWKLAQEGRFASDLFAGLNGMGERYYGYMPVHPLLLAFVFKGAGAGLFQARFETVSLGMLLLALTYRLALRLFRSPKIAGLAQLFLLTVRLTGQTPSQISGIVLVDVARIARYDIVVPVFGLLALHAYLPVRRRPTPRCFFLAGLAAGLAGLSHLYGLFWLPALLILFWWDRHKRRLLLWLALGALLPWLLYALYVFTDPESWRAQMAAYEERFRLLEPAWYLSNVRGEFRRYGPGLGPWGLALLLRPGFWATWTVLPLSLLSLARHALQSDRHARALLVPAALFPVLFALFISLKLSNYLVAMVPLWAIAAAWGSAALWHRLGTTRSRHWARALLALLLLAVVAEGISRLALIERTARVTTPYAAFSGQLREYLPAGARVLALHHYWFGLEDVDFRSFAVPISWSRSTGNDVPHPFDQALERVAPDVVLVDPRLRAFLHEDPGAAAELAAWLDRRNASRAATVSDPTYGAIEIWLVPAATRVPAGTSPAAAP